MLWNVISWTTHLFPQVNGITLLGENHQDVVNILKELPIEVTMVCCRRTVPPVTQSELDGLDLCDIEITEKVLEVRIWDSSEYIMERLNGVWYFLILFYLVFDCLTLPMAYKIDLGVRQTWVWIRLGTYQFCDLGQLTSFFWISVFSSVQCK